MVNYIRLLFFLLLTQFLQAQESANKSFIITQDIFGTRVFVENKGQFDVMIGFKEKVLYALDNDAEKIYFTKSGLYYEFKEEIILSEREREKREAGKIKERKDPLTVYIKSTWVNSDTASVVIIPGDKQQHYITYGGPEWDASTFKKLIYKNVYPKVDIEYLIPEDKSKGIKYSVIIHPGGNAAQVKILYSGDVKKLRKTQRGEISITSLINESITEHSPKSFYDDNTSVPSEFKLTGDTIMFNFSEKYDSKKTLIIDPWVVTTTNLSTTTAAYDVDYDVQGNTYVYGGKKRFKLAKYSNNGVLLWTFSGALPSFGWFSDPEPYAGNFCVNKFNGKVYIGQGVNYSGTQVIRLNSAGNYDFYMSTANSLYQEVWDMAISCITGEVVAFGGGHTSNLSAATISNISLNLTFATFQPTNLSPRQDVASHCVDDAGNFYVLYSTIANAAVNDKICKVNSSFNGNVWTQPTGFVSMAEAGNKTLYGGGGATDSNGLNCLAVNTNYLFYYDGLNLAAYTASTGVLIASITVNAPNYRERGGIAVDNCNNLYLGGLSQILRYQFTGTSFVQQTSIPLSVGSATNSYVFDVKLDKNAALLYVCGQGFVGNFNAPATANCSLTSNSCYNIGNPVFGAGNSILCAGYSTSLTPLNYANLSNPVYSVIPGPLVNTTGTFVVSPTVTTTYSMYVTGTATNNAVITLSSVTTVTVLPSANVVVTTTQAGCGGANISSFSINATFMPAGQTSGYSVNWAPTPNVITSNQQLSGTGNISPGIYTFTLEVVGGCSVVETFTILGNNPANFIVAPYKTVMNCYNPTLNLSYLPNNLIYSTSNGFITVLGPNPAFSGTNSVGVWTISANHPLINCPITKTINVTQDFTQPSNQNAPLSQVINCTNTPVPFVSIISPTNGVFHQWYNPQGGVLTVQNYSSSYVPGTPGIYYHCAVKSENGCSVCQTFTVFGLNGFPTFSLQSPQNFTLGCSTKSVANIFMINGQTTPPGGPILYSYMSPGFTGTPVYSPSSTLAVSVPGTYTALVKDNTTGCVSKVPLSIMQNTTSPRWDTLIIPTRVLDCYQPTMVLEAISSNVHAQYNWLFPGVLGNLPAGTVAVNANTANVTSSVIANYTFVLTDTLNRCITQTVIPLFQNLYPPKAKFSLSGSQISCNTTSITLTNQSSTGIPPGSIFPANGPVVAYYWYPPIPQPTLQLSTTYKAKWPGIYVMVARDAANGCTASTSSIIADARIYPVINSPVEPPPFVMPCGGQYVAIKPILIPDVDYSYRWYVPPGVFTGDATKLELLTSGIGTHTIVVSNQVNGCVSNGTVQVINDTLHADFIPLPDKGFAPLPVLFKNLSTSKTGTSGIVTAWAFGNGNSFVTSSASVQPLVNYYQPGIYTVTAFVTKGTCVDTVKKTVTVELPSMLEIPTIFTPNGDGINDSFFLKSTALQSINITIYDRWGNMVYQTLSYTGNINWDGKNQFGKNVAEGVYFYMLEATGNDGQSFERKGNITLLR